MSSILLTNVMIILHHNSMMTVGIQSTVFPSSMNKIDSKILFHLLSRPSSSVIIKRLVISFHRPFSLQSQNVRHVWLRIDIRLLSRILSVEPQYQSKLTCTHRWCTALIYDFEVAVRLMKSWSRVLSLATHNHTCILWMKLKQSLFDRILAGLRHRYNTTSK